MLKNEARGLRFLQRILSRNTPKKPGALQITLSFETVQKIVELLLQAAFRSPSDTGQQEPNLRPTLRPWVGVIDQILKEDMGVPKKLQTTVMRIFHKLRQEHAYPGCYNAVQAYVHEARTAANHHTKPIRKSRKKKPRLEPAKPGKKAELSIAPAPQEERVTLKVQPSSSYRRSQRFHEAKLPWSSYLLSRRPRRPHEPEELAFEWMRAVQQGTVPVEMLLQNN